MISKKYLMIVPSPLVHGIQNMKINIVTSKNDDAINMVNGD